MTAFSWDFFGCHAGLLLFCHSYPCPHIDSGSLSAPYPSNYCNWEILWGNENTSVRNRLSKCRCKWQFGDFYESFSPATLLMLRCRNNPLVSVGIGVEEVPNHGPRGPFKKGRITVHNKMLIQPINRRINAQEPQEDKAHGAR